MHGRDCRSKNYTTLVLSARFARFQFAAERAQPCGRMQIKKRFVPGIVGSQA